MMPAFLQQKTEFSAVPQTSDDEADMESLIPKHQHIVLTRPSWTSRLWSPLCLVMGLMVGAYLGRFYVQQTTNLDSTCIRHIAEPSVVIQEVDIEFESQRFNGSLFKKNVYRHDAGPEVDAAWEALGVDYRAAIVPLEQGLASGLAETQVQVNPKYGGGFPANVEGLHHLHCLNLLRQTLFFNYDYYHQQGKGAFKNKDTIVKAHVTHCLDTLRQTLMCNVDTGMLGQVWWNKKAPQAYPDFDTQHKCRNFDAIRRWAEINQAPADVPDDFLMSPINSDAVLPEIP